MYIHGTMEKTKNITKMITNIEKFYLEARSRQTGEWIKVWFADDMCRLIDMRAEFIRETDDYDGYRMVIESLEKEEQ